MYRFKRIFWVSMTILSYLMLVGMGWLLNSCGSKTASETAPKQTSTIHVDSTQKRLRLKVEGSGNQLEIIQNNTKTTVKTYENADSVYNSITVELR